MKKSNKILLVTAVGIFVAIPVIAGIAAVKSPGVSLSVSSSSALVMQTISVKNFDHVVMLGTWEVKINQGDQYQVQISMPKIAFSQYAVAQDGDTVKISSEKVQDQNHLSVTITLPNLSNLELHGTNKAELSGFKVKDFSLQIDGTNAITGTNNQFENLKLTAAGTSNIDLAASTTVNADVNIYGTNSTRLNMQGGDLTGSAKGVVTISYVGSVKTQNITTSGLAKVHSAPAV